MFGLVTVSVTVAMVAVFEGRKTGGRDGRERDRESGVGEVTVFCSAA